MIRSEYGGMARDIPLPSDSGSDLKVTEVKIDPQNLPLRILSKPKATRTDGTDCAEGIVRLKVQFLSNGQLGKIAVVNGLSKGLNQDAITAARKIRFEAATKRGRAISVRRTVEYSFFIY
ncbi:MAG: TonB family protein [Acidobacteria bacterium]|nr:TonB family protein [Acidobacteriota bacterium]